ncbi:xanthine dehydrogenase family protein molybdopterin-binding subunit [Amycolatopsis sp. GM8]|uniref:xanthine dehydrogenase family protein molybdopterin-binding subunit n=1 Tax=Amycolatopsis sp. GM8 TaxID=2896530 RepID=UPI001F1A382A|nr:xanthine dehydrogenase family protein molybdopterin-binding subunit [Amycolatopsis sp. GM8]
MADMPGPAVGSAQWPARRLDGERFVRGAVRYLDDEIPPDCLHLSFVRGTVAHARIRGLDTSLAARVPGVRGLLTGAEAASLIKDLVALPAGFRPDVDGPVTVPCLAVDRIRYAGEPLALVVADSERTARRAAELVQVDYEPVRPLLEIDDALAPESPRLHPQLPGNELMSGVVSGGDAERALSHAPHVIEGRVDMGRGSAVPLETRGCVASWDAAEGRLLVRAAVQTPHALRADLARQLDLAESDIRVLAPPLGGGFGFKFIGLPEEPLVCLMARRLGRPVRWVECREEALLIGAREYHARYRAGFDGTGRMLGLAVDLDANVGALAANPGIGMPSVAASCFPGGYDVADYVVHWRAVLTNKGPWNGARGYGKEITALVLEAAADDIARALGVDPVEVRRRNLLHSHQLPHRTATMTIDSGDYHRALTKALDLAGYTDARARQHRRDSGSSRIGIGVAFELTPEGRDPAGGVSRGSETATVRLDTSGHATVLTGVTSPGTGSETAIAQLVAERIGIGLDRVRVVQGDTDRTPYGGGSFSSRAVLTGGTAAWKAADQLRGVLLRAAAVHFGCTEEEIEVADGTYRLAKDSSMRVSVADLARDVRAYGSARPGVAFEELEATATYMPGNLQSVPDALGRVQQYPTYSYGVYVAEAAVDLDTGSVSMRRLTAVHDCGTVVNPRMVNAQINGAIAMGIGIALCEEETYTPEGLPVNTDFKRYLLPRLPDMPHITLDHLETPSPFSLLGTKGAGESGIGGTVAAIVGAVRDAIGPGRHAIRTPLTPPRVLAQLDAMEQHA